MSMEAIAVSAGVGKPAIYRRFRNKAALVAAVVAGQLPELDPPDLGDTRAELWAAVAQAFPADGPAYVGLIGGLIAEQERHPELIEAFRQQRPAPPPSDCAGTHRARPGARTPAHRPRSRGRAGPARGPVPRAGVRRTGHRTAVARDRLLHLVGHRRGKARPMIDFTIETSIRRPGRRRVRLRQRPRPARQLADEHRLGGPRGRRPLRTGHADCGKSTARPAGGNSNPWSRSPSSRTPTERSRYRFWKASPSTCASLSSRPITGRSCAPPAARATHRRHAPRPAAARVDPQAAVHAALRHAQAPARERPRARGTLRSTR